MIDRCRDENQRPGDRYLNSHNLHIDELLVEVSVFGEEATLRTEGEAATVMGEGDKKVVWVVAA